MKDKIFLTNHARDRLLEIYGFDNESDIVAINGAVNNKANYKVVSRNSEREVRQISYKKKKIQAVCNDSVILTFIKPIFNDDNPYCDETEDLKLQNHITDSEEKIVSLKRIISNQAEKLKSIESGQIVFRKKVFDLFGKNNIVSESNEIEIEKLKSDNLLLKNRNADIENILSSICGCGFFNYILSYRIVKKIIERKVEV